MDTLSQLQHSSLCSTTYSHFYCYYCRSM